MEPPSATVRCAVLGSPIAHSLSPVLHRAAYDELGLAGWEYDARDVDDSALAGFLDGLDGTWRGLSLTMPLKRRVIPLLDRLGERARQAQAANTVLLETDGSRTGDNTDIPGAAAALRERTGAPLRSAFVLGGGATAASVLLALADLGCEEATVLARDPRRVAETREALARHPRPPRLEVRTLGDAGGPVDVDVLVSTVPATVQDEAVVGLGAGVPVVFDVGYDPWPTPLASAVASAASGQVVVSGLDLLAHQAALQVELMTGRRPSVGVLRAAGEAALAARAEEKRPGSGG